MKSIASGSTPSRLVSAFVSRPWSSSHSRIVAAKSLRFYGSGVETQEVASRWRTLSPTVLKHASNHERPWVYQTALRSFSSKTKNPLGFDDEEEVDIDPKKVKALQAKEAIPKEEIVLFERKTGKLFLAKSGFGVGSFFSVFWVWYAVDFVPLVNSSGIENLHIHPSIPMIGLAFGLACQSIVTLYPIRLISKLVYSKPIKEGSAEDHELLVYRFALPFVTPSTTPHRYPVGKLTMDAASGEAQLVNHFGKLANFKGYIPLFREGTEWWHDLPFMRMPYLMDIRGEEDVPDSNLLLKAIMHPEMLLPVKRVRTTQSPAMRASSTRPSRTVRPKLAKSRKGRRRK